MKEPHAISRQNKATVSGRIAFQHLDFRYYWFARVLSRFGTEMLNATVLWQMWMLTKDPFDLGLIGLAQFAPFFLLFLLSGVAADQFQRKHIIVLCLGGMSIAASGLFLITITGTDNRLSILAILIFVGTSRAFQAPALHAIIPVLVPKEHFANAIAWSSLAGQTAKIGGPALMSALLLIGIEIVYGVVVLLFLTSAFLATQLKTNTQIITKEPVTLELLFGGLKFIWSRKIIFGAIGLDLFAVLLGGATALLPIYATEILNVGEVGYGSLRMAMMIGAFTCMLWLTQKPINRSGGRILICTVAVFGVGVIVFGLSTVFWASLLALFVMGASDSVSVFIRNLLVQSVTPDEMRGRVTAVSSVFTGASNEIGEFESGITAAWWGVVPAVVVGGVGTVLIAALFATLLPQLRGVDNLNPVDLARKYR